MMPAGRPRIGIAAIRKKPRVPTRNGELVTSKMIHPRTINSIHLALNLSNPAIHNSLKFLLNKTLKGPALLRSGSLFANSLISG